MEKTGLITKLEQAVHTVAPCSRFVNLFGNLRKGSPDARIPLNAISRKKKKGAELVNVRDLRV